MLSTLKSAVITFALILGTAAAAQAASGPWSDSDQASVRLVSAVEGTGDKGELLLGLEFQLQPGWKVYWRSPGDAGFPPRPDWAGSDNIKSVDMRWPVPKRFAILGLESFGYEDQVIFPLRVEPENAGAPIALNGTIDFLVCSDICVPGLAEVSLDLPAGPAEPGRNLFDISKFNSLVPPVGGTPDLTVTRAAVMDAGDKNVELQIAVAATSGIPATDIFVEGPEGIFFGKPDLVSQANGEAIYRLIGGGVELAALQEEALTLTVVDGPRALEMSVIPIAGSLAEDGTDSSLTALLGILGIAVLGGLILNLMPCVLPVLSLKLLSVVSHGGGNKRDVRFGFVASAAGIIAAFMVMAAALIALKMAGSAVGWGLQFQQPVFLSFMIVVVVLFAANLFGLFEIRLPQFVSDFALKASGDSKGQSGRPSFSGNFLTGAFAALLATPCSAPFLGTALGFALSRGPLEISVVFAALGFGLALPYLVVALFPGLATALPKPGAWMVKLRIALGVLLLATAVWLVSVLHTAAGTDMAISVAALALLAGAVAGIGRVPGSRLGCHAGLVSAGLAVAALVVPLVKPVAVTTPVASAEDEHWEDFDAAALQAHLDAGRVVFVDVTADWCITCQFNKARVFTDTAFGALVEQQDFVTMRWDWTRPNPDIAKYLASYGRYGIPFNVVYGPGAEQGIPLPELLDIGDVLAAVSTADSNRLLARQ